MQTRKRAKSVSFGKKAKDKQEKQTEKDVVEEKVTAVEPEKAKEREAEKVDVTEEKNSDEKIASEELSAIPPKAEKPEKSESEETATPVSEFVSDSPLSSTPETAKVEPSELESTVDNQTEEAASSLPEVAAAPIETPVQAPVSSEQQPTQPTESQELSATPPQSAFSIQSNETQAPVVTGENKKRFGVYFFIVAFFSFVLGLGAIATANYFGVIKLAIPHLPVAATPTPTTMPTAIPSPTAAAVDLKAYTISVLNGSTVAGKASDVKTSLTAAGFTIGTIGNADNSNFTKTEIAAKSTVNKEYLTKLQDELNKSFAVDTTVGTLPASSSSDVTVTLGSQTAH